MHHDAPTMNLHEIKTLLTDALGDIHARVPANGPPVDRYVTKARAYRMYGRSVVDRWIAEGLLKPVQRDKRKSVLDRAALHRIASKSNRATYLPVVER